MGDEKRSEDPQNVYRFVHQVTARGLEDQLRSAQVRIENHLYNMTTHIYLQLLY